MRRVTWAVRVALLTGTLSLAAAVGGCRVRPAESAGPAVSLAADGVGKGLAGLGGLGAALAAPVMAAGMRGFFVAGLGFVALGGLAFCFGGGRTAAAVFTLGVLTTGVGVLFSAYPWTVPLLAAAVVGVAAVSWWDRRRSDLALAVTTEVIETTPEGRAIKDGIKRRGGTAEQAVRRVVGPLKANLRKDGKIPDPAAVTGAVESGPAKG